MKGLQILSNPAELKLIANDKAHKILNLIRKKEYSGIDISKITGIKANLVSYYLRNLKNHGLAEIVRTQKIHGISELFYRATAENFLIHMDVGNTEEDISLSVSNAYIDKLLNSSMAENINNCIDIIVDDHMQIQEGTKVRITFIENNLEFLKRLILRLQSIGAHYRIHLSTPEFDQNKWSSLPLEKLELMSKYSNLDIEWADAWIILGYYNNPDLSHVSDERIADITAISRKNYDEDRFNDMKFMVVHNLPFEKEYLTEPRILERMQMYWKAASLKLSDYEKIKEITDYLLSQDCFRIESAHHNELRIRVRSDRYNLDAGSVTGYYHPNKTTFNLPSGELEMLPAEEGISGDIYCETVFETSDRISGVRLKIENNIVIDAKAEEGQELLESKLSVLGIEGKTISRIVFGLNIEMNDPELMPELISKSYGCVSIGFGNNRTLGGNIKDIPTWGLTCVAPSIWVGDALILQNSEFSIPSS